MHTRFSPSPPLGLRFCRRRRSELEPLKREKKIQTNKLIVPCRSRSIMVKTIQIRYGLQNDQGFRSRPIGLHQIKPNNPCVLRYNLLNTIRYASVAVAMFSVFLRTFRALEVIVSKKQNENTLLLGTDNEAPIRKRIESIGNRTLLFRFALLNGRLGALKRFQIYNEPKTD